jgi:hypothetical protein
VTEPEITVAIEQARRGIRQYLEIMDLFPIVDASVDSDFQKKFNAFYRIRQRSREWYETYYSYLENNRNNNILFEDVLDYLHSTLDRYEPSFSSKLVATLNPNEPIWDKFVLQNTGQRAPSYSDPNKIDKAKEVFQNIRAWYAEYLQTDEGLRVIEIFNHLVDESERISDLKKVDFVLWQMRT